MPTKLRKLDDNNYKKFKSFIAEQTGLHFPERKRADLERGVLEALGKSRHASIETYFRILASDKDEMDRLITRLTVGETYFYRDQNQFRLLENDVFPNLISEKVATTRRLRVWSAGCASGEEPYSIAIILRELIPYFDTWDTLILATDINRLALEKAAKAQYGKWSFRSMPETWLDRYFSISGKERYLLSDPIKNSVSFCQLNLKSNVYPSFANNTCDLDLIICRNVSIYFKQETTDEIMGRFYDCLTDGGYLLVGASDPIPPAEKFWARSYSGAFIYQKKSTDFEARQKPRKRQPAAIQVQPIAAPPAQVTAPRASAVRKKREAEKKEDKKTEKTEAPAKVDLLAEGQALLEMGQPALAADKLKAKLEQDPASVQALLLMAKVEVARGHLRRAQRWAERVIEANKLNVQAHYLLSAIHQGLGSEDKAIDALKKTIYLDKGFIAAHFSLGCLFKKQNKIFMAEKAFKNVVRLMVGRPKDEIVPETNGITYGKLLQVAEMNLRAKE